MRTRLSKGPLCAVVLLLLAAATRVGAANRLINGSFEIWQKGVPTGWHWYVKHGRPPDRKNPTPVGIALSDDQAYVGQRCIRFWKKSPIEHERYGMLYQDVKNLPPGALLHLRAMVKGQGVGRTYWGDWKHMVEGRPQGDFDWTRFSASIRLAANQTAMRFMIVMDGATERLWVDDLQLIADGEEFDPTVKRKKAGKAGGAEQPEYVVLGSFEDLGARWYAQPFAPWKMWQKGDAKVTFMRDAGQSAHGIYSIRISKQTSVAPECYGMLEEKITGLPAGATIHYRAMMKGRGVRQVWMGDWHGRVRPPDGDFDWRLFEGEAKLGDAQTDYTLRIAVEGKTEALWVDDVHVWLEGRPRQQREGRLFIRRMQPWARPGVSTIKGMRQFPEDETGFQVIVRNPESRTRTFTLHWTLCDALGAPMKRDTARIELAPLAQKRVTVPVDLNERRVACFLAVLAGGKGQDPTGRIEFVTAPPASLEPIKLSSRFGACAYPFTWSTATNELFFDQMAAGGYGDWRYSQMDRSFDSRAEKLDPDAMRWFFDAARNRGMTILPILGYGPTWASTAPPGASVHEKRMLLPKLDVWSDLVREFVAAHHFKTVEVWNEPDGSAPLGYPKHEAYAKLLNATYDAVKAVRPDIIVVGCSTQGQGTGWPESVLAAGGKMDAISFHPYRSYVGDTYRAPSIEKRLGQRACYPDVIQSLNEMSAKYNDARPLPLYATEIGFMENYSDGTPRLHGMELYKTQYLVRSFLTLAGLGVETTHAFVYGTNHGPVGYGCGQRPDFSLRPDWWATRTLQEVAAPREIGPFTPLTDDMFAVPMTGRTDAVAVWTVEDAAIVATRQPVSQVRDLFGRAMSAVPTKTGRAYVVPAGSVIYLLGAGRLAAADIEPLVRLRADMWKVAPGGRVKYAVEATEAASKYLPAGFPGTASVDFDPAVVRWAVGTLELPLGGATVPVPVMVPVKARLRVSLEFNKRCYPEVRIENNKPEAVDARIEILAGGRGKLAKVKVAPGAVYRQVLAMLPEDSAEPLRVDADIAIGGKKTHLTKDLYYAPVHPADIKVDGRTGDWKDIRRIALRRWHRCTAGKPAAQDFSAAMALGYDAENFFVLVEVTDDVHYQPFAAGQAWMGDSVQLAFDTNPTGEHNRAELDFALSDDGEEIEALRPLNTIDTAEVRYRFGRSGDQTIYELAFPLSVLNVKGRGPGTRLGFSLLVNENDSGNREGYLRWSDGIGNGKHPEQYGQLVFAEQADVDE